MWDRAGDATPSRFLEGKGVLLKCIFLLFFDNFLLVFFHRFLCISMNLHLINEQLTLLGLVGRKGAPLGTVVTGVCFERCWFLAGPIRSFGRQMPADYRFSQAACFVCGTS